MRESRSLPLLVARHQKKSKSKRLVLDRSLSNLKKKSLLNFVERADLYLNSRAVKRSPMVTGQRSTFNLQREITKNTTHVSEKKAGSKVQRAGPTFPDVHFWFFVAVASVCLVQHVLSCFQPRQPTTPKTDVFFGMASTSSPSWISVHNTPLILRSHMRPRQIRPERQTGP